MSLQGTDFDYKSICSRKAIDAHRVKIEAEKAKADALKEVELRKVEEEKLALVAMFSSAQEKAQ